MADPQMLGTITAVATGVIAVSAVVSAFLTAQLASENRRLRRAGTEPKVVAYIALDRRYRDCLNVVIANIGNGPAYNVEISRDADEKNFADYVASFKETPQRPPIPLLPPGERLETFLNVGFQLFHDDGSPKLKPFVTKMTYEDAHGKSHETSQTLDVASFEGLITLGKSAEHEVAESLKRDQNSSRPFRNQPREIESGNH